MVVLKKIDFKRLFVGNVHGQLFIQQFEAGLKCYESIFDGAAKLFTIRVTQ